MGDVKALNLWLSLSRCGDVAPGLDIVPRRVDHVVIDHDAMLDVELTRAKAAEAAGDVPILRPIFEPGDALFFDELFLHQTASDPSMPNPRFAIESWFFGGSAFPADYAPRRGLIGGDDQLEPVRAGVRPGLDRAPAGRQARRACSSAERMVGRDHEEHADGPVRPRRGTPRAPARAAARAPRSGTGRSARRRAPTSKIGRAPPSATVQRPGHAGGRDLGRVDDDVAGPRLAVDLRRDARRSPRAGSRAASILYGADRERHDRQRRGGGPSRGPAARISARRHSAMRRPRTRQVARPEQVRSDRADERLADRRGARRARRSAPAAGSIRGRSRSSAERQPGRAERDRRGEHGQRGDAGQVARCRRRRCRTGRPSTQCASAVRTNPAVNGCSAERMSVVPEVMSSRRPGSQGANASAATAGRDERRPARGRMRPQRPRELGREREHARVVAVHRRARRDAEGDPPARPPVLDRAQQRERRAAAGTRSSARSCGPRSSRRAGTARAR